MDVADSTVLVGDILGPGAEHPLLGVEEAHRAASEYLRQGWAVTAGPGLNSAGECTCGQRGACMNPGKHAYGGWGNDKRKTMNQSQVDAYWTPGNARWREKPVDQVFIVPYLSGLIVADVDKMDVWMAMEEKYRPETLFQKSGSGRGGHFIYSFDWDMTKKTPPRVAGKLPGNAGEIKFRGIIAAAPDVHPSGGRYRWENWGRLVEPAPSWMLQAPEYSGGSGATSDTLEGADLSSTWIAALFGEDRGNMDSVGRAKYSRPLVMFAVAASMAKWIDVGFITEDAVIERLLSMSEKNGALDKYGAVELTRQIKNGIRAGRVEK
jgi:hypothetical protein